jgi:2-methylcitrate dehydratase PrpD
LQPGGGCHAQAASSEVFHAAWLSGRRHGGACGRPRGRGARIAVTLKDGRTVERLVVDASGTAKNPMSAAQMREKFFDCAGHAGLEQAVAEKIAATLDHLGDQPSFAEFWPLLRKG